MTLLISYLLLALIVSSFCSVAEAVLLSVRPAYVAALEEEGHSSAKLLKKLTSNLDQPLAAILTANTIAHTIGAAGVGAQATAVFGDQYLGLVSAVLTLLILVISEIIPKTLGATYWKALAPAFARMINWLIILLYPLVWMSKFITGLIGSSAHGAQVSRSEVQAMAELGAKEGSLDSRESQIVGNILKLRKLPIRVIMTPRTVIYSLQADMTIEEYFKNHTEAAFSRIPIFNENNDDIIGYVLKSELFKAQAHDEFSRTLREFKRDFMMLSDKLTTSVLFDRLLQDKSHIALVVDEYGSVQGLVTLEDVFETIIGLEITDELDTEEDMQKLAQRRWEDRMRTIGIDPKSL